MFPKGPEKFFGKQSLAVFLELAEKVPMMYSYLEKESSYKGARRSGFGSNPDSANGRVTCGKANSLCFVSFPYLRRWFLTLQPIVRNVKAAH